MEIGGKAWFSSAQLLLVKACSHWQLFAATRQVLFFYFIFLKRVGDRIPGGGIKKDPDGILFYFFQHVPWVAALAVSTVPWLRPSADQLSLTRVTPLTIQVPIWIWIKTRRTLCSYCRNVERFWETGQLSCRELSFRPGMETPGRRSELCSGMYLHKV